MRPRSKANHAAAYPSTKIASHAQVRVARSRGARSRGAVRISHPAATHPATDGIAVAKAVTVAAGLGGRGWGRTALFTQFVRGAGLEAFTRLGAAASNGLRC